MVEVSFTPVPAHVRTARLITTAVARRAGVPEEFLDEVRLAVGEACSRAVGVHQRVAPTLPVTLSIVDEQGRFTVSVTDFGGRSGAFQPPDLQSLDPESLASSATGGEALGELLPPGFELAVIAGLVDDVSVENGASGVRVKMSWPARDPMAPDLGAEE